MLQGGRGGEVRLKLYLTMTMLAVRSPHDIKGMPAIKWAQMLALPDPAGNGARRVADAHSWLDEAKLIKLKRSPGLPPDVTLRSPSGSGKSYSWRGSWWINMPVGFWSNEWIYRLSGIATAFLLVFRDMRSNRQEVNPPWLRGDQKARYGFSPDSWTRARAELEQHSLLTVRRAPQGKDFDFTRLRNTYWVHTERLG
ncbi:hypothetical protein ACFYL6_13385 [Micromonospora sp. NPDC007208]|uniref:hypothetical protein n=1 Tax=Micromonospora sp. NPDC007208 TaxID=3364236 RepID=UPI0036D1922D